MKKQTYILSILLVVFLLLIMSCGKDKNCVEQMRADCICTMQYDPVCGCNDKTYGNACVADCAGVEYTEGACN